MGGQKAEEMGKINNMKEEVSSQLANIAQTIAEREKYAAELKEAIQMCEQKLKPNRNNENEVLEFSVGEKD